MTSLISVADLQAWLESEAFVWLLTFVKKVSMAVKGKRQSEIESIKLTDSKEIRICVSQCISSLF